MSKRIPHVKSVLKNKVLHYIFSRYVTYLIQFFNSIFIAVYLGPYYLGVWGFITLILQYLNQINLGIAHSVNAIIAINKEKEWYVHKVIGTSITMLAGLSIFAILFFVVNGVFHLNIGSKYNFSTYAPAIVAISIFAYFNTLFSNVFRVYGKVLELAINQSAFPILMLLAIFVFKGRNLLWALVGTNLLSVLIAFIIYLIRTPVKLKLLFIGRLIKQIQFKGWHLFVYNTSFYLIVISTRSFVSAYYSIEEFGYFTFAFALANAIMLLLQSFAFLIQPKILNRFSNSSKKNNISLLVKLRDTYIISSHLLVYLALVLSPLLFMILPQYKSSYEAFVLTALTVVLYSNSFGYSGLLIGKGSEKELGLISFITLIINLSIVFILTHLLKVHFSLVILGTMFTYCIYVYLITKKGRKYLGVNSKFTSTLRDALPIKLMAPYLLATTISILKLSPWFMLLPLILFLLFNFTALKSIRNQIRQLILKPEIIDI